MSDDEKQKQRAEEINRAVRDARKKDDAAVDLGTERAAGGNDGGSPLDKLLSKMDDAMKMMDHFGARMDALEKRHKDDDARKKDDDDEETEEERKRREEEGRAKEVVADSNLAHRAAFADAQTLAEKAYTCWGSRAPAPLYGERLNDYRIRLLRAMQKHSKQYSKSDLEMIHDKAVFDAVEQSVYADSIAASSAPDSVQPGTLRMRTRTTESGHRVNEFFGQPQAWMDRFGGTRRYVTMINPKAGKSD
jgi:hypothetical protein